LKTTNILGKIIFRHVLQNSHLIITFAEIEPSMQSLQKRDFSVLVETVVFLLNNL